MLSVVFGKTSPVYHPEEILTGDVVFNTTTQCTILDLTVNFCGISAVSLVVSKEKESTQNCEKIEESDIHLDVLDHLVRSYRGVDVEVGVNTYPFSLWLPPHLPSSHISPFGNINYYIHVHLQTSTSVLDFRKPFYVVAPVNINVFYAFQSPRSAEVTKKYGLFNNKTVRLKAAVSSTCFVPGDLVSVVVEVSNESSKPLQYLFCTLKQVTTVVVQLRDKVVNRVTKQCLKTEALKVTRSSKRHTWVCQMATSSSLTPTIANSSLILVTYSIQVSGKLAQVPIPPEVEIPIVFGVRAPVRPQHTVPSLHTDTNRTRRISQLTQSTSCSPGDSSVAVVPSRRRRYSSQPPLRPPTPMRRISHQTHMASQRISITLQPSFEDTEKPELFQSEQKESTNCSPIESGIPVLAGQRRRYNSQPPLRPPTPMRRISHQTHNVTSQSVNTTLKPSFKDGEKPELYQPELTHSTDCSCADSSIPAAPGRRRHHSTQPPLRPPTPMRRISHQNHNLASQRISTTLQPSFEDGEKPEVFQSEKKESTNYSPISNSIPAVACRRKQQSRQTAVQPPTHLRCVTQQIQNVAPQQVSITLQPSFEDRENPQPYQSEHTHSTDCSVDSSIPAVPVRRRRYSSQPPLRPPTPLQSVSHHTHNVASQRISITLQPSFEDAENPELLQTEV